MTVLDAVVPDSAAAHPPVVRLRIYGGPRLWVDDREVPVRSARAAALLVALADAGAAGLPIDELGTALELTGPATSVHNRVYRAIGEVRRLIEPHLQARDRGSVLLGDAEGYRLASTVEIDLDRVAGLERRLMAVVDGEDVDDAYAVAVEALEAVREAAGSRLPNGTGPAPIRVHDARRARIAGLAARWGTRSSRTREVLELVSGMRDLPLLDEDLQAAIAELAAAAGSRVEATRRVRAVERRVAELGAAPGPALQRARREISTPRFGRARTDLPAGAGVHVETNQERAALQRIRDRLDRGPLRMVHISGMPGVGKTEAALHVASQLAPAYPDGQLWVDARGFAPATPPLAAPDVAAALLEALRASASPTASDEQLLQSLRSAVADRRLIVVLDNVRHPESMLPIVALGRRWLVVTTSRSSTTSADPQSMPVVLTRWSRHDAEELLRRRLGDAALEHDPPAAASLVDAADGLPLALAIVAARIALGTHPSLAAAVERMPIEGRLRAFGGDDPLADLAAAFDWSIEALGAPARDLLVRFAEHPGPQLDPETAAAIGDRSPAETADAAALLVDASLLRRERGGFVLHDLLREHLRATGDETTRADARRRFVDHMIATVRNAAVLAGVYWRSALPADLTGDGERFVRLDEARRWYRQHRLAFRAAIRMAEDDPRRVLALVGYGLWLQLEIETLEATTADVRLALVAARAVGDRLHEGELLRTLGRYAAAQGRAADADRRFDEALTLWTEIGHHRGRNAVLRVMAEAAARRGLAETAETHLAEAFEVARDHGLLASIDATIVYGVFVPAWMGRWTDVLQRAAEARRLLGRGRQDGHLVDVEMWETVALCALGRDGRARAAAERLLDGGAEEWAKFLPRFDALAEVLALAVLARTAAHQADRDTALHAAADFWGTLLAHPELRDDHAGVLLLARRWVAEARASLSTRSVP